MINLFNKGSNIKQTYLSLRLLVSESRSINSARFVVVVGKAYEIISTGQPVTPLTVNRLPFHQNFKYWHILYVPAPEKPVFPGATGLGGVKVLPDTKSDKKS